MIERLLVCTVDTWCNLQGHTGQSDRRLGGVMIFMEVVVILLYIAVETGCDCENREEYPKPHHRYLGRVFPECFIFAKERWLVNESYIVREVGWQRINNSLGAISMYA
jgi:hypothetical protein